MLKIKFWSLRNKILLFAFALVFCLQIISTIVQYSQVRLILFGNMTEKASSASLQFVSGLKTQLFILNTPEEKFDFANLYANLQGKIILDNMLKNTSGLEKIIFLDPAGKIIIEDSLNSQTEDNVEPYVKSLVSQKVVSFVEIAGNFIVSIPVAIDDTTAGHLIYYFSNVGLLVQEKNLILFNILLLLVFLIVGALAAFFFAYRITKPVVELEEFAEKIGKGNLNIHTNVYANDEIGKLANTFNQMTNSLKKSEEAHKKSEDELLKTVEKLAKSEADLKKTCDISEKSNKIMAGRELKMIELKKEIENLKKK